jgi:replication-associated recombination protein RarA
MSSGYYQKKLGQYDFYEVISALRKDIKLGKTEDAIYWLHVLLTYGESAAKTAAKQLWIMAAEDIDDELVVLRAFAVYQMAGKVAETDHLYFLTARMCSASKWWETAEGSSVDYLWAKATGDLKKRPKEIPAYALDEHTARGSRAKKSGKVIDNRFSGHDEGRQQTKYLYDRDGRLDANLYPDSQFFVYWEQYKELLGEQEEVQQLSLVESVEL